MVDRVIFSRRLDALDLYLERSESLGSVSEAEFAETPAIDDLAERYPHSRWKRPSTWRTIGWPTAGKL